MIFVLIFDCWSRTAGSWIWLADSFVCLIS